MKRTYTSTLFNPDLTKATIEVKVLSGCKYNESVETVKTVEYKGIISWDIIEGGEEAEEIESMTDESWEDEYHEYLVLNFKNGDTATFRNSHVDMFIH